MASITPKENGTYLVRIACGLDAAGNRITKSRVFKPSKPNLSIPKLNRELEIFVRNLEEELALFGTEERPDRILFCTFAEKFLEIKKGTLSPITYPFYEKIVHEDLLPLFGKMRLRDIRPYHVQQYIQFLSCERARQDGEDGHIAPSTVRRYATVLRSLLTLAYKMEYIDENVGQSGRLTFPKAEPQEVDVYTQDEVDMILTALKSEPLHIRAVVEVALFTGLRRGEIAALRWNDINFDEHRISVKHSLYKLKKEEAREKHPKTLSSIRTLSIPDCLCETLRLYKAHQDRHASFLGAAWKNDGYLFTKENGEVISPYTPTRQFDSFLKRHCIRHLKFHGLRHTSATMLLANGCDIKTVSTRLGHADLETTGIYVHALDSSDRAASDAFDRLFGKNK